MRHLKEMFELVADHFPVIRKGILYSVVLGLSLADQVFATESQSTADRLVGLEVYLGSKGAGTLKLRGADSKQQILVTGKYASGTARDLTREVDYLSPDNGPVKVSQSGVVNPVRDGKGEIEIKARGGTNTRFQIEVEEAAVSLPINFSNQIVPIFTKTGCNGGGCHGKSGGQNGFRLSLLGFEPGEDYEHLVHESRGRRLFPSAPDHSLLLQKAIASVPHGGGKRLSADSADYALLRRWIAQGMRFGNTNDPHVTHIEVYPYQRVVTPESDQQLAVTAHYSDGSREDVTQSSLYEPNDKEMAKVDENGLVKFFKQPGDVGIMVRYQGKVTVFRATIPLGIQVAQFPPVRNFVDEHVFGKLKQLGMPASRVSDDSTFLRRVTLDLAGRLPTKKEASDFGADKGADKRTRLIDRLLDSSDYAEYFANKWSALLRNKRGEGTHARGNYLFHDWIRESLLINKPYDRFVREVVAASGDMGQHPPVAWYRQVRNTTTQLEDTAQLFLGLRIQCAQCHHHPYERWSQQDYYSFSAFFTQVGRKPGAQPGEEMIFHKRGVAKATNKKNKQDVKPAGLGSDALDLPPDQDPRQALADWFSHPGNPFFAKSLVNRYWKHFFNRGLVDPEDDMRETNPASNPELLDALAQHFIKSGFDMKSLIRSLCNSTAYQLSSEPNEHNRNDKQNFSRYYPKRLPAEVLYDSAHALTGTELRFDGVPVGTRAVQLPDNSYNSSVYFLNVFGRPDASSSCECERSQDASLAQSLHMLNAKELQEKIASDKGCASRLAEDGKRGDEEKIKELYLTAFSREPDTEELRVAVQHLEKKVPAKDGKGTVTISKRQAYEDVIWALMNTKEFMFNH